MSSKDPFTEGLKLQYDFFKHLTTLSTGTILLLVTLIEKLFITPEWKLLVPIALSSLLVTVISSLYNMVTISSAIEIDEVDEEDEYSLYKTFLVAAGSFLIGLISIAVFVGKNWM